MKPRIAINGFGRIGREVFRINLEKKYFNVIAINDLTDNKTLAHLLKYDSNFGTLKADVKTNKNNEIIVNKATTKIFSEKDPENLPWKKLKIDIVIEATGVFRTRELIEKHIKAGAKKVLLTAPPKDDLDITIVMGVNEKELKKTHKLVSNASCTTNCLAPMLKVLHENIGIQKGLMTTIHSYTNTQKILDLPDKDLRRARAACLNIIPTTTGATDAVTKVIPDLKGKLDGIAIRVPTPTVSLVDFTGIVKLKTTIEEINKLFKNASQKSLKGILDYTEEPLVSSDFKGDEHSCIFDALSTQVLQGNMIKVLGWYDNEWGYSARIVDLVKYMS